MIFVAIFLLLIMFLFIVYTMLDVNGASDIEDLNPPIQVEEHEGFYVVRDDLLPGGTKQRGYQVIGKIPNDEVVYAGPWNGYAQVALAIACKKYGKKATVVMSKGDYWTNKKAKKYGANLIIHPGATLMELQAKAEEYGRLTGAYVMPFGFSSDEFKDELLKQISAAVERANDDVVNAATTATIWVVAGSGTLARVLQKIFPHAKFSLVEIGRKVYMDDMDKTRTKIYKTGMSLYRDSPELPPYSSPSTYDAKVWPFVKKYGEPGDIIWNVAAGV
jgi:hypothetical protein